MAGQDNPAERSQLVQDALSVTTLAAKACEAYKRPDLGERIRKAEQRLIDPAFNVLVVGEFKQGKSSLINALLNAPICPVDDDIATSSPTMIRYAEQPTGAVIYGPTADDDSLEVSRQQIPVDQVVQYVTEMANPENRRGVQAVEVGLPRKLLSSGLVLVDTPGVGGMGSAHAVTTLAAMSMADALIFVSDASQEFSQPEIDFLERARSMCPNVVCIISKIDFYPEWRKIVDLNAGHLQRQGIEARLLPVSSTLRQHALTNNDREANAESGFTEVVGYLQNEIAANAEQLTVRTVAADLLYVVDQLEQGFGGELSALNDPEKAAEMVAELTQGKARAERLRGNLAKWQQSLMDGIGDLQADVDHDLRARIRAITKQSDEAIEASDPGETWEEFEPWLYRRTTEDIVSNYNYLRSRADELAVVVAEHFESEGAALVAAIDIGNPAEALGQVNVKASIEVKESTRMERANLAFRGSYSGGLPVMMLGSIALGAIGLGVVVMPIAALGFVFGGRRAVKDTRERELMVRRNQAKNAHRKYTDEVLFKVNQDSKAELRRIQRVLRDHYAARAEEMHRTINETLSATQTAVKSDEATRAQRLRDVTAELERVGSLRKRVSALAPDLAGVSA